MENVIGGRSAGGGLLPSIRHRCPAILLWHYWPTGMEMNSRLLSAKRISEAEFEMISISIK